MHVSALFMINSQAEGREKRHPETSACGLFHLAAITGSRLQLSGRYSSFHVDAELLLDTSQSLVTAGTRLQRFMQK